MIKWFKKAEFDEAMATAKSLLKKYEVDEPLIFQGDMDEYCLEHEWIQTSDGLQLEYRKFRLQIIERENGFCLGIVGKKGYLTGIVGESLLEIETEAIEMIDNMHKTVRSR